MKFNDKRRISKEFKILTYPVNLPLASMWLLLILKLGGINVVQQVVSNQTIIRTIEHYILEKSQLQVCPYTHKIIHNTNNICSVGRILQSLLVGLVVGFSFWDIGNSTSDVQMRTLAIFQILILGNFFFLLFEGKHANFIVRYHAYWSSYATIPSHERTL